MEGPYGKPFTQTIELKRVGDGTRLAITSRFDTPEERDGVVNYGAEQGAIGGWARLDALLKRLARRVTSRRRRAARRTSRSARRGPALSYPP
jgi:hypothetical protein